MAAPDGFLSLRHAARIQAAMSFAILAITAGTVSLALFLLPRDEWLQRIRHEHWMHFGRMFEDGRYYDNPNERLLYGVIPDADFREEGVYLTGASVMQSAIDPMDQIAADRDHIHNYCMDAQSFTEEYHFIRFLVDREGFLLSGAEKKSLIIGICMNDAVHDWTVGPQAFWRYNVTVGKLYSYDPQDGLRTTGSSSVWRQEELLQYHAHVFWGWVFNQIFTALRQLHAPNDQHRDPAAQWRKEYGATWTKGMPLEIEQFGLLIDYLRDKHIRFRVVYLPEQTWCRGFPLARQYREAVLDTLAKRGVPFVDLIHFLPDEDFGDAYHVAYSGAQKLGPVILDIAHDLLRQPATTR